MQRFNATFATAANVVLPSPTVTVLALKGGGLANIFADEAATQPLTNPFTGGADGHITFCAPDGAYKVSAQAQTGQSASWTTALVDSIALTALATQAIGQTSGLLQLPAQYNRRGTFVSGNTYSNNSGAGATDYVIDPATGFGYQLLTAGSNTYTSNPSADPVNWMQVQGVTPSSIASGAAGAVIKLYNVQTLSALPKSGTTRKIILDGYYKVGDGGGGEFYEDPTDSTSAANGGTIFVAADGGRYKRPLDAIQQAAKWGIKGDGSDESVRLQAICTYLTANGGGITFGNLFPSCSTSLSIKTSKPTFLSGNNRDLAGIRFTNDADGLTVDVSSGQPFYTAGFNYFPAFTTNPATTNNCSAGSRGLHVVNNSGAPVYGCFAAYQIGFGTLGGTAANWFQDCLVSNVAQARMIEPKSVGYMSGSAYSTTGTAYRFEATACASVDCRIESPDVYGKYIAVDRYTSVAPGLEGLAVIKPKFVGVGIGDRGVNTMLAQGYLPPDHISDGGHTNCNQASFDWTGFQSPTVSGFPILYHAGVTPAVATAASPAHVILRACQGGVIGVRTYNVSGGDAAVLLFDSTPGVCAHTSFDPASFIDQSSKSTTTMMSVGTNHFNLGLEGFRRIGGGEPYDSGLIGSSTATTALSNRLGKVSNARRRFYFSLPVGSSVLDASTVYEGMLGDTAEIELDTPNGAATITNILSRGQGQKIELLFNTSAQVTVQRNANVLLYGGANVSPTSGSYMGLKRGPAEWREDVGRAIA